MNIAHLDPPHFSQQGDHVYRTQQPVRALGQLPGVNVVAGTWLSTAMREACREADILVVNKVVDPDLLPLLARRKAEQLPTIYEINDDVTALHAGHPTRAFFARPDNRSLLMQLARAADAIQFSTPSLARTFGHLNARTAVFPNHLWELPTPPQKPLGVTLGWAGSKGHLADVASVAEPLLQALDEFPHVVLAVMGDEEICTLFKSVPGIRLRLAPPGSLADYNRFLETLDIGVAPLLDNGFNRGRSDVKFLEFAAAGVAAICADLAPYSDTVKHGETGLLFGSRAELKEAIARLISDAPLRSSLVGRARQYVADARLESTQVHARLEFYRKLAPRPDPQRHARFEQATRTAMRVADDSCALELTMTAAEQHLYNGLFSQQDRAQAEQDWRAAWQADPANYLAPLYLGNGSQDFAPWLEKAASLAPESCAIPYALGVRLSGEGDNDAARQAFETAIDRAPRFAPAHLQLGALAERAGDTSGALHHYSEACASNPDFPTPALLRSALYLRVGPVSEALNGLQRVQAACANEPQYWLLLGKAHLVARDAGAADRALSKALELAPTLAPAKVLLDKVRALHQASADQQNLAGVCSD